MPILWKYFKEQKWWVVLAFFLAAIAQLLSLTDPIIFGKIIDEYATNPGNKSQEVLVKGVLYWLSIAIGIAIAARIAKAFQEYYTRLSFQEFEESHSGETLSILQKVKTDTERFINSFINILFSSLVGMGFLIMSNLGFLNKAHF